MSVSLKKNWGIRLSTFLTISILVSALQVSAQMESLPQWLQTARKNNPMIASVQANVEAKKKEIRIATALPDPSVSAGYFVVPVETRVGPQRAKIGASQMVPWPGKLMQKKRVAEKEYAAAQEALRGVEARVFAEVRAAYAEYYEVGREIDITRDNLKLLKQMESNLLTQYATARVQQLSILKVQVEMAILEDQLNSLDAEAIKTREKIVSLLNISSETALNFPTTLPVLDVPVEGDTLLKRAMEKNPALLQVRLEKEAATAHVGLARRMFTPDLMFMTDYIFTDKSTSSMTAPADNGKNPWIVGGSITLPLWAGNKIARIDKANAMEAMQQSMVTNTKNLTETTASSLIEDYRDARRKVTLYEKDLIPKAKQTIALVEEAYINAKATVLDYLDAQRMLLKLEIALEKQRSRREMVAGKIDMLLGGERTRRELGDREKEGE